jgi:hypothetical protein
MGGNGDLFRFPDLITEKYINSPDNHPPDFQCYLNHTQTRNPSPIENLREIDATSLLENARQKLKKLVATW